MAIRISRRELALAAAGMASAVEAQRDDSTSSKNYVSALDGLEGRVDGKTFDPVRWTLQRHDSAPLKLTFQAKSRKQAEAWQKQLRAKIIELTGVSYSGHGALRAQTLEVREFPGYKREKFIFESKPGVGVLAYLITPAKAAGPVPVVVCLPGHGRGVDDLVGIDEHGRDRTNKVGYQYDFALQVAEHGMAAVAIEPMAFGCRRDAATIAKGQTANACQPAAGSALLLGETMVGWRVYDVMRTIDWIETNPALDAKRVGCMGISGGGTITLFSTAMEPRIRWPINSGQFVRSIWS